MSRATRGRIATAFVSMRRICRIWSTWLEPGVLDSGRQRHEGVQRNVGLCQERGSVRTPTFCTLSTRLSYSLTLLASCPSA